VIHRDDHRLPCLSVHDTFHTNLFPYHDLSPPWFRDKKTVRIIPTAQNKNAVGSIDPPTASTGYSYFLKISHGQWVDFGPRKPVKIKPSAKIAKMKLIHFSPQNLPLINTTPIPMSSKIFKVSLY
jgi:hypothetical protein